MTLNLPASLLLAALLATPALAQTPAKPTPAKPAPAKPAAAKPAATTPAADNKTATLGAGTGRGPILTRDELRACLSQEDALRTRTAEHQASRAPIDADKEALTAQQAAVRDGRGPLDDLKRQADELGARITAHTARVEAWNKKVADHNAANAIGPSAERQRMLINREREEIEVASKKLNEDRARITSESEAAVAAYNAKAMALDTRVNEWNARNQAWNDAGGALDAERKTWVANCGDRRYREDDEAAIRRGR